MYNNNSHPDPFAGQYPKPPPPQDTNESSNQNFQPVAYHSDNFSQPIQDTYAQPTAMHLQEPYAPPSQPMHLQESYTPAQPETYVPPQMHQEIYSPPERADYYHQPTYYSGGMVDEERNVHGMDHYRNEQPLDEYLRQEREEYMKHELPKKTKNESDQVIPFYKKEDDDEPEKIPMVQQPILSKKERKKLKKQQDQYQPYIVKPTLAPENEPESYKYRPSQPEEKSGCNCCCYNPAITCCSFFCLLISLAFLAAGIALMIASKVVTDKCNNQCSEMIDQAQNACGTICSKVLHDGMFYGGIVVAALAGIAVIWKLIMWTCAGYSKR